MPRTAIDDSARLPTPGCIDWKNQRHRIRVVRAQELPEILLVNALARRQCGIPADPMRKMRCRSSRSSARPSPRSARLRSPAIAGQRLVGRRLVRQGIVDRPQPIRRLVLTVGRRQGQESQIRPSICRRRLRSAFASRCALARCASTSSIARPKRRCAQALPARPVPGHGQLMAPRCNASPGRPPSQT